MSQWYVWELGLDRNAVEVSREDKLYSYLPAGLVMHSPSEVVSPMSSGVSTQRQLEIRIFDISQGSFSSSLTEVTVTFLVTPAVKGEPQRLHQESPAATRETSAPVSLYFGAQAVGPWWKANVSVPVVHAPNRVLLTFVVVAKDATGATWTFRVDPEMVMGPNGGA